MLNSFSRIRLFATLRTIDCLCPWVSPGKNIGVGCCTLLQGSFLTQVSNPPLPHLPYCRRFLYCWAIVKAPLASTEHLMAIMCLMFFKIKPNTSFQTLNLSLFFSFHLCQLQVIIPPAFPAPASEQLNEVGEKQAMLVTSALNSQLSSLWAFRATA